MAHTGPIFKNSKGDLTNGSVGGHLVRLTIPMIWGILAIISFQLVDMYFVSQLPGTAHLAAMSFTFPVTFALFSIIMGFGIAMSSVLSRLIGEEKFEDVKRVTTHGLFLVLLISIGISVTGYYLQDTIFGMMVDDKDKSVMLPLIREYMSIWFAGAVFVSLPLVGNAALRAAGDTLLPAIIMTIAAVMNVILDPILIFGLFGFPRLELQGAAIATVFANACAMLAGLYVLAVRKGMLSVQHLLSFDQFGNSCKRLLIIAIPAGMANAIQPLVNALIVSLLAGYGTAAVAAFGIVSRVEAFAFVILMGLAVGMGPIIGQNFGAKKFDRVNETLRKAMAFNIIWSIFVAVILGILAKPIAGLFENDPDIIQYAALFFWIVPFSYIFANLFRGWASAFNAMGKPHWSFMMIIFEMVLLLVPAIYLGKHLGGVTGIFVAIAIVNVIAGLFFHIWSWNQCRKMERQYALASQNQGSPGPSTDIAK